MANMPALFFWKAGHVPDCMPGRTLKHRDDLSRHIPALPMPAPGAR
jgi:hypothetical protein